MLLYTPGDTQPYAQLGCQTTFIMSGIIAWPRVPTSLSRLKAPRASPTAPPAPVVAAVNCPDARAVIVEPGANQQVNGPVQIIGTAQTGSFQYYKIEFNPAGAAGDFSFYLRRDNPVNNGPLGVWDPSGLPPGPYQLRLVTVDATGNFGQCSVTVNYGG